MRGFYIDSFGSIDSLRIGEVPEPGASGVRIRVHGAAINPADLKVISGSSAGRFLHAARFPLVPGFDFSGVVEKPGDSDFSTGEEVYGHLPYSRSNRQGTFAEWVVVPAGTIARKPTSISHPEAAAVATVGCTALQALRKGRVAAGQKVLINGASGGVGSMAVQIAVKLGAEVSARCSASKADFARELGATAVLDYSETPLHELAEQFDIVFDVASKSSFWECRPIMTKGGTYITLLPSAPNILGMALGWAVGRRCKAIIVQSRKPDLEQLAQWIDAGDLRAPVAETLPFEALPLALHKLRNGEQQGKIALVGLGANSPE